MTIRSGKNVHLERALKHEVLRVFDRILKGAQGVCGRFGSPGAGPALRGLRAAGLPAAVRERVLDFAVGPLTSATRFVRALSGQRKWTLLRLERKKRC